MSAYEAVIDLTVEIQASSDEQADKIFLKDFTDEVLALAKDKYKIWIDIRQISKIVESN
jgi:hypothetical protein